ncbi:MAG: M48 family metalloprotease [Pseudohongiellaceae bacterium]
MSMIRHFLLVVLCSTVLLSCATNPATGRPNLVLMGESREMEIGREEHEKVLSSMRVMEEGPVTEYVREVGQRVADASHRDDLEYTFTVIDSPEINAFALPGGYVYINRGLLAFLNTEDQLAAVLAHEVGHITARHAVQQQARGNLGRTAAGIGGFVAAVATGSAYVGSELSQLGSLWTQAGVSGFGRENELEADSLSAEYLRTAGYDPQAVLDVLSILKNQEDFNVQVAGQRAGYHGLFATHPRNDERLQSAVGSVSAEGESGAEYDPDPARFRQVMNGMVFGQRHDGGGQRYYHDLLGYTMVFPPEWSLTETPSTVTATAPQQAASLQVESRRMQRRMPPHEYLRDELGYDLSETEALNQYRLQGHTGVVRDPDDGELQRIAVIYLGLRAMIFRGTVQGSVEEAAELERMIMASIRSFRVSQPNEEARSELNVEFVRVGPQFSWAALAQQSPLPQYAEETLRLINGYYPIGNPQPGEWIKILE